MKDSDDVIIERPYGRFTSPEALIEKVMFWYYKQDTHQKDIAEQAGVPLTTVLEILSGEWGDPAWYGNIAARGPYKPPEDRATDTLHLRCRTADKERWTAQAQAQEVPLAKWVIAQLDAGADFEKRYSQDSDDLLHYAHTVIEDARKDWDELSNMIGVSHRARQTLVNLSIDINRLQFAIRGLVKERDDG